MSVAVIGVVDGGVTEAVVRCDVHSAVTALVEDVGQAGDVQAEAALDDCAEVGGGDDGAFEGDVRHSEEKRACTRLGI